MAFAANAGVLWVVLRNRALKRAPTSVFLVNLCATDLAIALVVIPVATVVLILWSFDDDGAVIPTSLCGVLSFFHTLLFNAGAWAAAAISVDRRFSIVSPMAHSAFMTSRRALLGVALVWVTAILFSIIPHLYRTQNSGLLFNYTKSTSILIKASSSLSLHSGISSNTSVSDHGVVNASSLMHLSINSSTSMSAVATSDVECHLWKTCALMFSLDWSNPGQVFALFIGCYLLPTSIMVTMYFSIFRVARRCGLQGYPSRLHPCNSAISTISEEVDVREDCERNSGGTRGEGAADGEHQSVAPERNGSRIFGAELNEDTLDRIGIQITERPQSRGDAEKDEATRHCIFQHLFPEDKGPASIEGPFPPEDLPSVRRSRLNSRAGPSRQASGTCRCVGNVKCANCCRASVSKTSSCINPGNLLGSSSVAGYKAKRTLLLILGLSISSLTPYYALHAYCATTDDCWTPITSCPWGNETNGKGFWKSDGVGSRRHLTCEVPCNSDDFPVSFLVYHRSLAALIVVWLLFLSAAFNPILYGLLNRPVREQILLRVSSLARALSHAKRCVLQRLRGSKAGPENANPTRKPDEETECGEEDFMQFLERTSSLSDCFGPRCPGAAGSSSATLPRPPKAEAQLPVRSASE